MKHVGSFPTLEDQMVGFTAERAAKRSDGFCPDRVDALVWGLTELFPDMLSADDDETHSTPSPTNQHGVDGVRRGLPRCGAGNEQVQWTDLRREHAATPTSRRGQRPAEPGRAFPLPLLPYTFRTLRRSVPESYQGLYA